MNISVVIPVSTDLRLKRCIDSIDESVEVVISLNNPSKDILKMVKALLDDQRIKGKYPELSFTICEIKEPSIAEAYNNGIKNAKYNKIFLMDSDCIFQKGCITKLNNKIGNHYLSKGKVVYQSNSFISSIVSRAREFHSSDEINAYSPPLLFKKTIINKIGGYYFHPKLCWLEDSEFDARIKAASLYISFDLSAKVFHPPLSFKRDLKSAFWYGVGKRIGVNEGVHIPPSGIIDSFKKYVIHGSAKKGFLSGLYLFLWKMTLITGYLAQGTFVIRK